MTTHIQPNFGIVGTNRPDEPDDYHPVTVSTHTDESLREDILELLESLSHFELVHLNVDVKEGVIVLNGSVSSQDSKNFVEDALRILPGVVDVVNHIYVAIDTPA